VQRVIERGTVLSNQAPQQTARMIRGRIRPEWRIVPWQLGAGGDTDQLIGFVVGPRVSFRSLPASTAVQRLGWQLRLVGWLHRRGDTGCEFRWSIVRPGTILLKAGMVFAGVACLFAFVATRNLIPLGVLAIFVLVYRTAGITRLGGSRADHEVPEAALLRDWVAALERDLADDPGTN
jgi:hypothetical protein